MPSREDVRSAVEQIRKGGGAVYEYFFQKLQSPKWIGPLVEEGFFKDPPSVERLDDLLRYPLWPESRYLARIASEDPAVVSEVMCRMPETDNVRVHEDLVDAALGMPASVAVKWAVKECGWISGQEFLVFLLPQKLGKLVGHLARGGEKEAALALARSLLGLLPPREWPNVEESRQLIHQMQLGARMRMDRHEYEEVLGVEWPEVVKQCGFDALSLACDLLESAARYGEPKDADDVADDLSYIWRPAIEDHDQNRDNDARGVLVSAVRDTCGLLLAEEAGAVGEIVERLEQRRRFVFHRIALHVVRENSRKAKELARARITKKMLFDELTIRHEYALLAGECFDMLSEDESGLVLGWIRDGPDLARIKENWKQNWNEELSDEELKDIAKQWRRDRLWAIRKWLEGEWREQYASLVGEVGEAAHPDFPHYSDGGWTGPVSPKSMAELQELSLEELVAYLRDWKSEDEREGSAEGLGRVLQEVIRADPATAAQSAVSFCDLDPTYIRALVNGIAGAVETISSEWKSLLELCSRVMERSAASGEEGDDTEAYRMDRDPDLGWTRRAIADLLGKGFAGGTIPWEFREKAWTVLEALTRDSDPTPAHEAEYGGSNMDPATLSINTTRGTAMHSVVRYLLWARRTEGVETGLRPEVRRVLEDRLDTSKEPSVAVRAVYGQWFPWIAAADPKWTKQNAGKIFPMEEEAIDFWCAAWATFVVFCNPSRRAFEILQSQYECGVARVGTGMDQWCRLEDPDYKLGVHLLLLYASGVLREYEKEHVIRDFFAKAEPELRGRVCAFAGKREGVSPDKEGIERLQKLWEERRSFVEDDAASAPEIRAFGWWFGCGLFDPAWSLRELRAALGLGGYVEASHLVLEKLEELASDHALATVVCLHKLIKQDEDGRHFHGWLHHVGATLRVVLESGDEKAAEKARETAQLLGAKGFSEFRDLAQQ